MASMLEKAGLAGFRVELSILDDAGITLLHKQSLGCEGPTNILSFPAGEGHVFWEKSPERENAPPLLGWLALSADTFARECFLYGQTPEKHCLRLLAHGIAHLAGLDHGEEMDRLCTELELAASCM